MEEEPLTGATRAAGRPPRAPSHLGEAGREPDVAAGPEEVLLLGAAVGLRHPKRRRVGTVAVRLREAGKPSAAASKGEAADMAGGWEVGASGSGEEVVPSRGRPWVDV